ncbi:hypothetical protein BGW36DRAFT_457350 [Talaromyces proteolyticus]|uniref:Xylanolytic transcriptional activator regulatory domain-containing protein n=1 Tax=Talaromyces proteolyticus TaxID=1131652 RepID=A0AAD4L1W2_9EURO|nr:uncharacterized protein BGW36DRAFT_457350 [Talaromyces proteolyticus]KAH8706023.1 hypothetical protein BGW36DRAFT_457350 [Talaromyces proteolyticus]
MDWNTLTIPEETVTGDETANVGLPIEVTVETYPVIESDARSEGQIPRPVPKDSFDHVSSATLLPFSYLSFLMAPNLGRLQPADIAYLESKKSLHIPAGLFLEVLLSHYFLYTHPCLPIINEAEFWKMFRQDGYTEPSFSLLVLQAMLFVASSYIPIRVAKQLGEQSVLEIRNTYYRRAKLLYDFGIEEDPIRLSQACILLSFQSCKTDHLSNTTWLALAIQHARRANAHLYYRYTQARQTELKRLWWSVLIRDRIIAIGMRRPIQVLPFHFDPYSREPLQLKDLEAEIDVSEVYNKETKVMLCKILTSLCNLVTALTMLITTIYPPSGIEDLDTDIGMKLLQADDIKSRLRYWESNHMVHLSFSQNHHSSVRFYSQLTTLYYDSARLALFHYISLWHNAQGRCHSYHARLEQSQKENRPDLLGAITSINEKVKRFIVDGTATHLPISAVAYTITPQILLNISLRLTGSNIDRRRHERFLNFYTELTRLFHLRYDVSHVKNWIEQILQVFEVVVLHCDPSSATSIDRSCSSSVDQTIVSTPQGRTTGKSFSEFLDHQPTLYLQLLTIMDHSMSTGNEILSLPGPQKLLPSFDEFVVFPTPIMQPLLPLSPPQPARPMARSVAMSNGGGVDGCETVKKRGSPHTYDSTLATTTSPGAIPFPDTIAFPERASYEPNTRTSTGNTLMDLIDYANADTPANVVGGLSLDTNLEMDNLWMNLAFLGE